MGTRSPNIYIFDFSAFRSWRLGAALNPNPGEGIAFCDMVSLELQKLYRITKTVFSEISLFRVPVFYLAPVKRYCVVYEAASSKQL